MYMEQVVLAAPHKMPPANPQVPTEPPPINTFASSGLEMDAFNFEAPTGPTTRKEIADCCTALVV